MCSHQQAGWISEGVGGVRGVSFPALARHGSHAPRRQEPGVGLGLGLGLGLGVGLGLGLGLG